MARHEFAIGQAGTGKTTWLIDRLRECARKRDCSENNRILALTFMHGARRRLDSAIRGTCPGVPVTVSTIDGFAQSLLNRWRSALGYRLPVMGSAGDHDFEHGPFSVRAGFNQILVAATALLHSATVAKLVGQSHPLIVIDEFQDCHGPRLEFIVALSKCAPMLVAADAFQLLDVSVVGCPAVEWADGLKRDGHAEIVELQTIHRTTNQLILDAARSLRTATPTMSAALPVFCFDGHGPAGYKLIETLVFNRPKGSPVGSVAIITPSHNPVVSKIVDSYYAQCEKRSLPAIKWQFEINESAETSALVAALGISDSVFISMDKIAEFANQGEPIRAAIHDRLERLAKLRGLSEIPTGMADDCVRQTVHSVRAFTPGHSRKVVTTVHGAKNREFDRVFVIWPFNVPSDSEAKRRLLYNAVTRAKTACVVLVQGKLSRAANDPVLQLLGPAQPVFTSGAPAKRRMAVGRRPSN